MSAEENAENKYEVREVIGKGAFGEVNLVVEKQTKQRYVLKRIKMARQSEWQRKATRQEIEIASRLRHPFIMQYKEHWTHHGHTINVVYGYCEKGDLTSAITKQKGKYFAEETLRLWLAELLLAIDYMHREHVLHRDIKTQNILLTGDGDVQIGDFGLSTVRVSSASEKQLLREQQQQQDGDDTDTRTDASPPHLNGGSTAASSGIAATPESAKGHHTLVAAHVQASHVGAEAYTNALANAHANGHNGHHPADKDKDQLAGHTPIHDKGTLNDYALVGTPHFMSPELLSSQKYSYETDIWSLGVVMYELTTLKPPFNAFNLAGLVAKIKKAALPPMPSCYSADWTAILRSMLRKDPIRRASPLELLAMPTMQQALQQAWQRALAISPNFVMPKLPAAANLGASPGFCFAVGAAGGRIAGAGAILGGQQTPAAGTSTPVLVNPQAGVPDEAGGTDGEPSPLPKFPDLAAAGSPLPALTIIPAVAAPHHAAPAPAQHSPAPAPLSLMNADVSRGKTPATARRPGAAGAASQQPGAAGAPTAAGAATGPGAARRPTSPQRTRAPPVAGGARSGTPSRVSATVDTELNPRVARKSTRSRSVVPGRRSPQGLSGSVGAAAAAAAAQSGALSARTSSPTGPAARHAGRRAGPSSGPVPRVAAVANSKRSVLDDARQSTGIASARSGRLIATNAAGVPATTNRAPSPHASARVHRVASAQVATTANKVTSSPRSSIGGHKTECASPAITNKTPSPHSSATVHKAEFAYVAVTANKAPSPHGSSNGQKAEPAPAANPNKAPSSQLSSVALKSSSPSTMAGAASAYAGGVGAGGNASRAAPWRSGRPGSLSTARTSRAALAAVSASPQASPRDADAAASGQAAGPGRTASLTRGGPVDPSSAAATVVTASTVNMRRAGASASDGGAVAVRRPGATSEAGTGPPHTARPRVTASPLRRSNAGAVAGGLPYHRRSQPGAAAGIAVAKDGGTDGGAAAARQPEKRVRRSSFVSYGKPAESAPQQRRAAGAAAPQLHTAREAAVAKAKAVNEASPVASHPLAASDAALDSCPVSSTCSPLENPASMCDPSGSGSVTARDAVPLSPRSGGGAGPTSGLVAAAAAVVAAAAAAVGAAPGASTGGAGHPWRQTPRSRSVKSMTTEDSELSIPDGSRYGLMDPTNAQMDDTDPGNATSGLTAAPSPRGVDNSADAAVAVGALPLCYSNQLYSGSYGSYTGSFLDAGGAAVMSAGGGAAVPQYGSSTGARAGDALVPLAGAAALGADLPRRVSASAFAPHLYGDTTAAAEVGDDASGTESGVSTVASMPRLAARPSLRRLAINDILTAADSLGGDGGIDGGGATMQLVSPDADEPVLAGRALVVKSPSALSSASISPTSSRRRAGLGPGDGGGDIEIVSPTAAVASPSPPQHLPRTGSESPASPHLSGTSHKPQQEPQQQHPQPCARLLDDRPGSGLSSPTHHGSRSLRCACGAAPSRDASTSGSLSLHSPRQAQKLPQQQQQSLSSPAAAKSPPGSPFEATLQRRPRSPEAGADDEKSVLPALTQQRAGSPLRNQPGSDLSGSERMQLALFQRVVSLAASLWEKGRDVELGAVLSSTLSRALVRQVENAAVAATVKPGASGQQQQTRSKVPELGDAVRVVDGALRGAEAVVRYRGPCHWNAGTVLGLELRGAVPGGHVAQSESTASPPGCRDGVRYFRCQQPGNGAAFLALDQVALM